MKAILILLAGLALAACDTAGRNFGGLTAQRITIEGRAFDVRLRADGVAEAVRLSAMAFPSFADVAPYAGAAAAQASGCTPKWLVGDPSVVKVGLQCGDKAPPRLPKGPREFACDVQITPAYGSKAEARFSCPGL